MLERDSTGFKIDHLNGVSITHWSKKSEPRLIIDRDSEMGSTFLGKWVNLSFRQSRITVFKDK
jgi:hypothetical protein